MAAFDGLVRETLLTAALLCFPILAVATAIGAAVAVFQAATQIQEQTLSLLPKLIGVGAALAVAGSFGMRLCAGLFNDVIAHMAALTLQ